MVAYARAVTSHMGTVTSQEGQDVIGEDCDTSEGTTVSQVGMCRDKRGDVTDGAGQVVAWGL